MSPTKLVKEKNTGSPAAWLKACRLAEVPFGVAFETPLTLNCRLLCAEVDWLVN